MSMSVKEKFRRAWTAKFPSDSPPELNCLDGGESSVRYSQRDSSCSSLRLEDIDLAAVERSLQRSNELMANLTKQLQQQEFISSFLWDTVHAYRANAAGSHGETAVTLERPASKGPSPAISVDEISCLDEPIPIQDASSVSFSPCDENVPSGPTTPVGDIPSGLIKNGPFRKQHSTDCVLSAPQHSNAQVSVRKKSLPFLDDLEQELTIHDENRTHSLDSGKLLYSGSEVNDTKALPPVELIVPLTLRPNRPELPLPTQAQGNLLEAVLRGKKPKPIPAPRTSIMKPLQKAEVNIDCSETGRNSCGTRDAAAGRHPFFQKKSATQSFQNESRESVVIPDRRGHSSMKNLKLLSDPQAKSSSTGSSPGSSDLPKVKMSSYSPTEQNDLRPARLNRSAENLSRGKRESIGQEEKTPERAEVADVRPKLSSSYDPSDYEEAMPVHRAFIESNEASSDEDEPLYYNLMLLKQQTLNRVQTLYSKPNSLLGGSGAAGALGTAGGGGRVGNQSGKLQAGAYKQLTFVREVPLDDSGTSLSSESVRSAGSDSVFDEKSSSQGWRKRQSMYCATDSVDSQSECDELDAVLPLCPEDEKLQMRKWVITSILQSEHSYLSILDILMQYMQTFKNLLGSAQVVISSSEIDTIFSGIPELHLSHKMFVHELEPKVENWSPEQQVAATFKKLAQTEFKVAPEYLKNYQKAVVMIHRCWQENPQFATLTKEIQVKGKKKKVPTATLR